MPVGCSWFVAIRFTPHENTSSISKTSILMPPNFLVVFAVLFVVETVVPPVSADTILHYNHQVGDDVTTHQEQTVTTADGVTDRILSNGNYVDFSLSGQTASGYQQYELSLAAPKGSYLKVGNYSGATRFPFETASEPGLDFSANGSGNNKASGQFEILEITFDPSGNLLTLAVNFFLHGDIHANVSYGQLRYNSNVPLLTPDGVGNLSDEQYQVSQTAGNLTVQVNRNRGSSGPLSVDYATAGGTAVPGRDYTPVSGSLMWADGETASKNFTVPILNSGDPTQPNGTFLINLSGPGAGEQVQAIVTVVTDNSSVTYVHFDYDDFKSQTRERLFNDATGYLMNVTRNSQGGVSVQFSNAGSVSQLSDEDWQIDFRPIAGVAFGPGDYQNQSVNGVSPALSVSGPKVSWGSLGGNFQVLEAEFAADGSVRKFSANFNDANADGTSPVRGEVRYNSQLTIPPTRGAIELSGESYSVYRDAGSATIIVNRVGGSSGNLSVGYYASEGTAAEGLDFATVSGTLDWSDGDAAPKTFEIPVLKRSKPSAGSFLYVQLGGLRVGARTKATLSLNDSYLQPEGIAQFPKFRYSSKIADSSVSVTVVRVGGSSGALPISYSTVDGTAFSTRDYISTSGSLYWSAGDAAPKTVVIPLVKGRADAQTPRSFAVVLTDPSGNIGTFNQASVTISRTEVSAVSVVATTAETAESGGAPGVFTLTRSGDTSAPLTIKYRLDGSARNGQNYRSLVQRKVIKAGRSSAQLLVRPIDLGIVGGKRTVKLTLVGSSDYSISGNGAAKVKINQDR